MSELSDTMEIGILAGDAELHGDLSVPSEPAGVVVFAHGSGSSRKSPRNVEVADRLNRAGFATLLFDLLTPDEERIDQASGELRFDIPLLGERLVSAITHAQSLEQLNGLKLGCFGASTGAAAALTAATQLPGAISAVVSRGGRPDLAGSLLPAVKAPTLLIVGGRDPQVLEFNRAAKDAMRCPVALTVIPRAGHLFEEPGALYEVSRLAVAWYQRTLS